MLTRYAFASRLASLASLALPALSAAGCGDNSFTVQHAAGFPHAPGAHVSVFGVYKDGRLAPEAWDPLRVHLAPLFGAPACEAGFPDLVTSSGTPVLQAVDDYSRANGVTDELLDKLGAAAKGDFVLLVTETGRPGVHPDTSADAPSPSAGPPTLRAGGANGGRRGAPGVTPKKSAADSSTFEVVALLFSVHAHKTVGAVRMSYTGASFDDAMQTFFGHLGAELPGAACEGWRADLHLDVADIKKLDTE